MSIDYTNPNIFGIPKPESRKKFKTREDRRHDRKREKFRYRIWHRDGGRCRCCRMPVNLKAETLFTLAHIHEIKSRGQGGDDLDSTNCITLCNECHLAGLHHQMAAPDRWIVIVVKNTDRGADDLSGIEFRPWKAA